jgi:hypothetical protein
MLYVYKCIILSRFQLITGTVIDELIRIVNGSVKFLGLTDLDP